jgi:chaperonin cofactor prefoldin
VTFGGVGEIRNEVRIRIAMMKKSRAGIRSDFKAVAESVMLLREKTDKFENRMDGFDTRFDRLEDTLRLQALDLREDFRVGLIETKQEIVTQISEKIDRFESRLSKCESDIAHIKEDTSPINS